MDMTTSDQDSNRLERYVRQIRFAGLGEQQQRALLNSRVLVCGCGALGTVLAETLVRAGVGSLKIADRDFVELSNLQRQVLFDENDLRQQLPKAIAAVHKLQQINSETELEAVVADIDYRNVLSLARDVDLILDATDNFEIRFLINEAALELNKPWIYAGVVGSHGQTMTIIPGETACLRCLIEDVPDAGTTETCDTAGVIGPAVNMIASLQAVDALKLLSGQREQIEPVLTIADVWERTFRTMNLKDLFVHSDCPACKQGKQEWLTGKRGSQSVVLCGRNAVQIVPDTRQQVSFDQLARNLAGTGAVLQNTYLLRLTLSNPDYELTLFRDGRAIITGTEDLTTARGLYARYIGQ